MSTLESAIAAHPFSKDLNSRCLELLTGCAASMSFDVDHQIFRERFDADYFYLIQSGCVALQTFVPNRGPATMESIGGGEALGWSWLFPPYHWHFSAVATEPTVAVALSAHSLRAAMEENPEFGYAMAMRVSHVILNRMQSTRLRLLELYNEKNA